jgi:hypothetical protein
MKIRCTICNCKIILRFLIKRKKKRKTNSKPRSIKKNNREKCSSQELTTADARKREKMKSRKLISLRGLILKWRRKD